MEGFDPQEKAIKTIDKNLAVNAGAGTGKTKVLTERFVHILEFGELEKNKEVESIVAITFTKKATQEMVSRIRGEIRQRIPQGEKWKRFYRDMEKSNISTIHGFCAQILRSNPIEAKIDPLFEILEDYTGNRLLKQAILEELNRGIEEDESVYKMFRTFRHNEIRSLGEDFYKTYNKIRTTGISFLELKNMTLNNLYQLKINPNDILVVKDTLLYLMDNLSKNTNIYKLRQDPLWIKFLESNYENDEIYGLMEYFKSKLGKSTKEVEHINRLKEALDRILLCKESMNLWIYETVLEIFIKIDENYSKKKREVKGLDYDDLQIKVLELFNNQKILAEYQKKYRYIMIDEFQDTNELQKNIFYKLTSRNNRLDSNNLFIVGDPKQSIYGFRGADIQVFYDVMEDIQQVSDIEPIIMHKNYRSVDTILQFVNDIFSEVMDDKYTALTNFKVSNNEIDIEILEEKELEIPEGVDRNQYQNYYEAELIAKRIRQLVEEGKYDYKDFALLFRSSTRNFFYEEALKNHGIPYYNTSSKRFYHQQEVLDLINALKSISNPYDTIPIIGFLRSPMIGLSDNTIYWLLKNMEKNLFQQLKYNEEFMEPKLERNKVIFAINLLETLYMKKHFYNINDLLDRLVEETYFEKLKLLEENGKQKVANIHKFKTIAKSYDENNNGTLEDFIDYIEEIKDMDEAQGIVESENANVVKLLTIHKSKGLQFPVVVIPEMAKDIKGQHPAINFNKDKGIGLRITGNRALYDDIRGELDKEAKEEDKRILYVAMTRAEEMIILGNQGGDRGFKKMIEPYIPKDKCKEISYIDLNKINHEPIKQIHENYLIKGDEKPINLPLLYEESYNKRVFERHNITEFLSYRDCKRKFYLDYYIRLNSIGSREEIKSEIETSENKLSAIEKGNIIHRFCQEYRLGMDRDNLLKDSIKYFNIEDDLCILQELQPYVDNYIKNHKEDYDNIYYEKPFYFSFGNTYISGIIDRINIKNGRAEIIDFKTNKVKNKKWLIDYYRPQLQLYGYVVEEIMGIPLDSARILFLENGEYADIQISKSSLEANLKDIEDYVGFINNNSNIEEYKKSDKCNQYCNHKSICILE